MNKTIMKNGIVFAVILMFLGITVTSSANVFFEEDFSKYNLGMGDELDQYQTDMDLYGIIGRSPEGSQHYYVTAQGVTPTKNILTRVELLIRKGTYTTYDLLLQIRDDHSGNNLTMISKSHTSIPSDDFNWIEFDFDDILVNPGTEFIIVCSTYDTENNWYDWGITLEDAYPNGTIGWTRNGKGWYIDPSVDTAFKTYGRNNRYPDAPIIDGQKTGKVGVEYEYKFLLSDPDEDAMYLRIDWGSGTPGPWEGPYSSGETVKLNHTWDIQGTYTIKAQAKDFFNVEGLWGELTVTMPRNKEIGNYFLFFLKNHPNLFPIIKYLLGLK